MKHRKHILTSCVLLALFVCVSAAPVFADGPPEPQTFGIGGNFLIGINVGGLTMRYWSESKLGLEAGVNFRSHWTAIPVSVLYTLSHIDTNSMYIRPYIGGGININRFSFRGRGYSESKIGGQGVGGVEFTPKNSPRFSFGGNLGIHNFGSYGYGPYRVSSTHFMLGLHAHYYIR